MSFLNVDEDSSARIARYRHLPCTFNKQQSLSEATHSRIQLCVNGRLEWGHLSLDVGLQVLATKPNGSQTSWPTSNVGMWTFMAVGLAQILLVLPRRSDFWREMISHRPWEQLEIQGYRLSPACKLSYQILSSSMRRIQRWNMLSLRS
jgi:hypothetical protein